MQVLGDVDQGATARLRDQLRSSRVGQRWERMFRLHAHEIETVFAVHADVRADVSKAVTLLVSGTPLDAEIIGAVERVLDDLQRHASVTLQRDLVRMRDELVLARGRTLQELLVD